MTVTELYNKLASKEFQDPANSDLFYNFFIYRYPAREEAALRRNIKEFKDSLVKPVNYIDVLTIDVFEAFCAYLDQRAFGNKHPSMLNYLKDKDASSTAAAQHETVTRSLANQAHSREFMQHVHEMILGHVGKVDDGKIRPYVFLYGFGTIYPYLRANEFLSLYEPLNKASRYKIILFYPGESCDGRFSLFGKLKDGHAYRAHVLVN